MVKKKSFVEKLIISVLTIIIVFNFSCATSFKVHSGITADIKEGVENALSSLAKTIQDILIMIILAPGDGVLDILQDILLPEDDFVGDLDSVENKRKLFMPSENTISEEMADIVIYGHIHIQCSDNLYNRIRINVGSVGNALDFIRNKKYDANVRQTTRANYVIIEGEYGEKEKVGSFSYQFVKLPYNIDKELETEKYNFERDSYIHELKEGQYRDLERIKKSFQARHIDMDKF